MRTLCLALLTGCFLKPEAKLHDAGADGAIAIDAGSTCPTGAAPMFTTTATIVTMSPCTFYVPAEDGSFAVAYCNNGIAEGPPGGPFAVSTLMPASGDNAVQLAPEGDRIVVRAYDGMTTTFVMYSHVGQATWKQTDMVGTMWGGTDHFSPPSRRTAGSRIIVWTLDGQLHELDGANGWSVVHSYASGSLGVDVMQYPSLTPDGLHLVFAGRGSTESTLRVFYAERATVTDMFGTAHEIAGITDVSSLYLANDCSRILYSPLGGTGVFARGR